MQGEIISSLDRCESSTSRVCHDGCVESSKLLSRRCLRVEFTGQRCKDTVYRLRMQVTIWVEVVVTVKEQHVYLEGLHVFCMAQCRSLGKQLCQDSGVVSAWEV
jgi:hypothetical protein